MTTRDWKWTVSILISIIIYLLTYHLWGKSGDITNVVSIGSGLVSIALALVAIIYAFLEGKRSDTKELKVNTALDSIIENINNMKGLINKLDSNLDKTHNKVTQIGKQIDQYESFYSNKQESKYSHKTESNDHEKPEQTEKPIENNKTNQNKQSAAESAIPTLSYTSTKNVKRGDIFSADISPTLGSEMGGIRLVLILQNEIGNRFSPTTTIAPLTARIQKGKLPTHVEISAEEYSIPKDSVILLEQISTIDKSRLKEKIAHLEDEVMEKVEDSIMVQLGLVDF